MNSLAPKIIRASAGTGKTFALSSRYIALLARGEKAEKILATTFTRKAAGEIYQRIVTRLAEAASSETAARELASFIDVGSFSSEKALEILRSFTASQHRLSICTLDSLFFKIAACFSLELGLPPTWSISNSVENYRIIEGGVATLCREIEPEQLSSLMRLLQARSYKRSVFDQVISEAQTLYELFRSSKKEAWYSLSGGEKLSKKEISKLIEAVILQEIPKNQKGEPNGNWKKAVDKLYLTLLEEDWREFVEKGFVDKILDQEFSYQRLPISQEWQNVLGPLIAHARAVLLDQLGASTKATYELLNQFDAYYRAQRAGSSALSFSDVKYHLYNRSVTKELGDLYYRLDSQISHLLLDEFQDTSFAEWRVIEPIVEEIISKAGQEHTFFCVGDVKQAIYSWRGGAAEIFDSLEKRWPHIEVETTEISYRCSQAVIDTVNRVFSSLGTSPISETLPEVVETWSKRFRTHSTARSETAGFVSLTLCRTDENAAEEQGDVLTLAAKKIKEIHEKAPQLTIGVLCRKNSCVTKMIYRLLADDIAVPASEEGGNPLTDSLFVNIALAVFRFIDHPGDGISYFLLKNSPLCKNLGLNEGTPDQQAVCLRKLLVKKGLGKFTQELVEVLENYAAERDQHRLQQLSEMAYAYESKSIDRLLEFVDFICSEKVEDPSSQKVRVMTIHQAKGLEFDVVILPELDEVLNKNLSKKVISYHSDPTQEPEFISRSTSEKIARLDPNLQMTKEQVKNETAKESLSVLYVAMTRAVHSLYMFAKAPSKVLSKAEHLPKSYAGIISSALVENIEQLTEGGELYRSGEEYFLANNQEELIEETKIIAPKELVLKNTGTKRRKGLLRQTASAIAGADTYLVKDVLRIDQKAARERGLAVHSFLEKVKWLEDGAPCKDIFRNNFHSKYTRLDFEKIYGECSDILEKKNIRDLLLKENYPSEVKVYTEWAFAYQDEVAVVPGFIDRLVVVSEAEKIVAAEVIDYKTDILREGEDFQSKLEFYKPQLEVYREAVARYTGLAGDKISFKLVFTSYGEVLIY